MIKWKDDIAKDLSYRILNRKLFEYKTIRNSEDDKDIISEVEKLGYNPEYYVFHDAVSQTPYSPYARNENGHNIWVLEKDGSVVELSKASDIVKALTNADLKEEKKVYYPVEHLVL